MTELHPDLVAVRTLLGTWSGRGHGEYPTIEPFDFAESVTFGHVGKPFLSYQQRTRSIGTPGSPGMPMHAESGYWRFPAPGRVELVLSHPTGVVEIEEGTVELMLDGAIVVELATTQVIRSASAKEVTGLERTFRIRDDVIEYTVRMAAVGEPMQHHLAARLERE
jgi:hypothetical protein